MPKHNLNQNQAEQQSQQWLEILTLSPEACVSFDRQGLINYVNPAFEALTGLSVTAIIGMYEDDFSALLAGQCKKNALFPGLSTLNLHLGKPQPIRSIFELAGNPARILEAKLRKSESAAISKILYLQDITDEAELNQIKSDFLSTAAHELRTPMACIHGYLEVLLTQEFSETERKEFFDIIYSQSKRIILIINELLDLARIESQRGKDFVIQPINLADFLNNIALGFKIPDGRLFPEVITGPGSIWTKADPNKLAQALNNILSNAYKYSPDGERIEISLLQPAYPLNLAEQPNVLAGIRITDYGIGMSEAEKARIFDRFYRANSSGTIPGTGLGMSIVKEIIELHNGTLTVDSLPGKGTTVTIWLPVFAFLQAVEKPIEPQNTNIASEQPL